MTATHPIPQPAEMHRRILAIALPAICANLTTVLPGLVDTAFIGRTGDAGALGGVAIGASLCGFVLWAFSFLRMGTAGFTAQAYGAGDDGELQAVFRRSLVLAAFFGAVLLMLMVPINHLGMMFYGPSPLVSDYAGRYVTFRLFSAPFDLLLYVVLGWLLGTQHTVIAMALQLFLNLLNILLCMLFVLALRMGVDGAAIATALAQTVTALLGLAVAVSLQRRLPSRRPSWMVVLEPRRLVEVMAVNRDIFIRTFALMFVFTCFVRLGARFGDVTLAANHILFGMVAMIAQGLDGFAQAAETLTGQAIGARDIHGLRRATRFSAYWAGGLAILMSLILLPLGPHLLPLFSRSAEVLAMAQRFFPWVAAAPIIAVSCFQLDGIYIGATRGRDMRNGMLMATLAATAIELIAAPLFGNQGLWFALMSFFVLRAVPLALWYHRIPRLIALPAATRPVPTPDGSAIQP
ncbi:MAG TPA: MATE family efflux transporter [Dongiaceae bacterium]|nr:MATE family efflux transporter [Dongiaceae bacterium]